MHVDHNIGLGLYEADEYVELAVDPNPCAFCKRDVPLNPIADFYTLDNCTVVCDDCAAARVPPQLYVNVLQLRKNVPIGNYGVLCWSSSVAGRLFERYNDDFDRCAECSQIAEFGDKPFWLCQKGTRRPICDDCAERTSTRDLWSLLYALREQDLGRIIVVRHGDAR